MCFYFENFYLLNNKKKINNKIYKKLAVIRRAAPGPVNLFELICYNEPYCKPKFFDWSVPNPKMKLNLEKKMKIKKRVKLIITYN